MDAQFCTGCGAEFPTGEVRFCDRCGVPREGIDEPMPVPATAAPAQRAPARPAPAQPGYTSGTRFGDQVGGTHDEQCRTCGRRRGAGLACQFCSQVSSLPTGVTLATPAKRLGSHVLDGVLAIAVTAVAFVALGAIEPALGLLGLLAWPIWAMFTFVRGQTPAKMLLNLRVVRLSDGRVASWGTMFLRDLICKPVIAYTIGWLIFPYLWLTWDQNRQQLWDKMVGSVVVDDPRGAMAGM